MGIDRTINWYALEEGGRYVKIAASAAPEISKAFDMEGRLAALKRRELGQSELDYSEQRRLTQRRIVNWPAF
jgi:hypothetical protein